MSDESSKLSSKIDGRLRASRHDTDSSVKPRAILHYVPDVAETGIGIKDDHVHFRDGSIYRILERDSNSRIICPICSTHLTRSIRSIRDHLYNKTGKNTKHRLADVGEDCCWKVLCLSHPRWDRGITSQHAKVDNTKLCDYVLLQRVSPPITKGDTILFDDSIDYMARPDMTNASFALGETPLLNSTPIPQPDLNETYVVRREGDGATMLKEVLLDDSDLTTDGKTTIVEGDDSTDNEELRGVLSARSASSSASRGAASSASGDDISKSEEEVIQGDYKHDCLNNKPVPLTLSRADEVYVWDVEGKRYFDFDAVFVNQGHCHKRLVQTMKEQVEMLTLTSRAFYSDVIGQYEDYIHTLFNYDKVLLMSSGIEACEAAIKLARSWAYEVKGVPENKSKVVIAKGDYWGRSIAAITASSDPDANTGFGPCVHGFETVEYGDLNALEDSIRDPNTAAFMVEPIQCEAGVVVPDEGYIQNVALLCLDHNVLLIVDEVQSGLGRTGKLLCHNHDGVRPDMVVLGKALSGGMYPVAAVLCDDHIMNNIKPGQHGSTYGGNPNAARLAMTALDILISERLCENALKQGYRLMARLRTLPKEVVGTVRGRGLLCAIVINQDFDASQVCLRLKERGLLAKNTHGDIIRFTPPLCINQAQIDEAADIIISTIQEFAGSRK